MKNSGFTLTELVIVIAVILVISAVAVPGILNYQSYQSEDQFVNQVVDALRNAQNDALTKNVVQKITFTGDSLEVCATTPAPPKCQTFKYSKAIFTSNSGTYYFSVYGDLSTSGDGKTLVSNNVTLKTTNNFTITINKYGGISRQ